MTNGAALAADANSSARIKQVAAALIFCHGKILVARRAPDQHLAGLWEFPGGKLENDESPQHCIVRELAEEMSIHVVPGEILIESLFVYPGGTINLIGVLASASSSVVEMTVHDAIKWLDPDNLLSVDLAPADIPIAKEIARRFGSRCPTFERA